MATNASTCTHFVYVPINFKTTDFQNAADMIYASKVNTITALTNGTYGIGATGNPMFKSDFERMQYLLGQQKVANCGVQAKSFIKRL